MAVILIIAASIVTIADNPPGIALLYAGIMSLFLAFIHPWKDPRNYGYLAGICGGIIGAIVIGVRIFASIALAPGAMDHPTKVEGIFEAIFEITIMLVCIPGIILGIAEMIYRSVKK